MPASVFTARRPLAPGGPHGGLLLQGEAPDTPHDGDASSGRRCSKWLTSTAVLQHAGDLAAAMAVLIVFLVVNKLSGRQVYMVTATMTKHSYPRKRSSVPGWAVPLYSILAPVFSFVVWKFTERRRAVTWYDLYRTTYTLLFNIVLVAAITDCLKVAISRPRPNWFYQCWPNGTMVWQPGSQNAFGGMPLCAKSMSNYNKSFPSGHASMSASGLGFLSYWMLGQMRVFVGSGAPRMWSFFVAMIPFLSAIVVGVTRITDYWHTVSDVCFGLLLGYSIALVCYLQVYPWFTDSLSFVPRYVLWEGQTRKAVAQPLSDDAVSGRAQPGTEPAPAAHPRGSSDSQVELAWS